MVAVGGGGTQRAIQFVRPLHRAAAAQPARAVDPQPTRDRAQRGGGGRVRLAAAQEAQERLLQQVLGIGRAGAEQAQVAPQRGLVLADEQFRVRHRG